MNYKKIYDNLIDRGRSRDFPLSEYGENHHILPRCLGGNDDCINIVRLTPEEHYVAHQLLCKIHPTNHSLIKAAVMMIPNRPTNKMYGWLKRRFSEVQSLAITGTGNAQFGKVWIYSLEYKCSKIINLGELDIYFAQGWLRGRKLNFNIPEQQELVCNRCNKKYLKPHRTKFCSLKCFNETKPCLIRENFDRILPLYQKYGALSPALKECGIGYNSSVFKRFFALLKNAGIA
jgi:hypothetical protein